MKIQRDLKTITEYNLSITLTSQNLNFYFKATILVDSVKIGYLATNMQFLMAKSKMY